MNAILYKDINDYYFSNSIEEPQISRDLNVKIKVNYCGICGSDIHKLLHERPDEKYVKTNILGHEVTGTVIETMPNVKKISVGDHVVIEPLLFCGKCKMCKNKHIQFCKELKSIGKDIAGGFSEYIIVNEQQIHKVEKEEDLLKSTLCDPYAVSMHIKNLCNNIVKKKIAIIGDGIIGLSTAELVKKKNNDVYLFGKHKNRNEILDKIDVNFINIVDVNKYLNQFDIVIETVGGRQNDTLVNSIKLCVPKGKIIIAGVFDKSFNFSLSLRESFYKELSIVGCNSFEKNDFNKALNYLTNNSVISELMISKIYDISDFNDAIKYIKNRKENECIKIIIKV